MLKRHFVFAAVGGDTNCGIKFNLLIPLVLSSGNEITLNTIRIPDANLDVVFFFRFDDPRVELFYVFEFLRDMQLTTFLVSEMPLDGTKYSEFGIEDFLADGIIHLRLTPFRRNIVREVSIVKMRATNCNNDVFSLEFSNGQFTALYGGQNPLL